MTRFSPSKVNFRPHHVMCTLSFQGKGYSPEFVNNYKHIVQDLTEDTQISIVQQTDDICAPCPHKRGLSCAEQEKIKLLDQQHQEALGLREDSLSWKEAKNLIKQNMTMEKFHHICSPCEWKKFGICEKVLKNFLAENNG